MSLRIGTRGTMALNINIGKTSVCFQGHAGVFSRPAHRRAEQGFRLGKLAPAESDSTRVEERRRFEERISEAPLQRRHQVDNLAAARLPPADTPVAPA